MSFEDHSFTRIAGLNGSGKSSLFSGISYSLYGKALESQGSLCSYGEKSFKTVLTLTRGKSEVTITRVNSPKSLKVVSKDKTLKDDEAQEFIIKFMGLDFYEFRMCCYYSGTSILDLTPQERYEMVCRLSKIDAAKNQELIDSTKGSQKRVLAKKGTVETQQEVLEERVSQLKERLSDLSTKDQDGDERDLEEEETKLRRTLKKELDFVPDDETEDEDEAESSSGETKSTSGEGDIPLLDDAKGLVKRIRGLMEKKEELSERRDPKKLLDLAKKIEGTQKVVDFLSAHETLLTLVAEVKLENEKKKKKIDSLLLKAEAQRKKKEKEYEEKFPEYRDFVVFLRGMWTDYEVEVKSMEAKKKEKKEAMTRVALAKSRVETFREVEGKTPKKIMASLKAIIDHDSSRHGTGECPGCGVEVRGSILEGKLKMVLLEDEDDGEKEIARLTKEELKVVESALAEVLKNQEACNLAIEEIEPPDDDLKEEEAYLASIEKAKGDRRGLAASKNPAVSRTERLILTLKSDSAVKKYLEGLDEDDRLLLTRRETGEEATLEKVLPTIKSLVSDQKTQIEGLTEKKAKESVNSKALLEVTSKLKEEEERLCRLLKVNLKPLEKYERLKEESESRRKNLEGTKRWRRWCKERDEYQKKLDAREKTNTKLKEAKEEYRKGKKKLEKYQELLTGFQELLKVQKEAVLRTCSNFISFVNEKSGLVNNLAKLFPDPISVNLGLSEKTDGKVIVRIRYRNESVKYSDLSPGEKQKCGLAFFLAIHNFLGVVAEGNEPLGLILIDEAINRIDETYHIPAMNLLKETQGTRLVISHETIEGIFDEEVRLESSS
jgi:DNA repair exonuclease SbcCD ATPase subunit